MKTKKIEINVTKAKINKGVKGGEGCMVDLAIKSVVRKGVHVSTGYETCEVAEDTDEGYKSYAVKIPKSVAKKIRQHDAAADDSSNPKPEPFTFKASIPVDFLKKSLR
jgi:hypothetical protein